MAYSAKILLDSVSPRGNRLTTFELTYPRFVHAEFMTHRVFSRNASSSRAIPISKMIERVVEDPAMFVFWGKNQSGMQAAEQLSPESIELAKAEWLKARDNAVASVKRLQESDINLHKQSANRLLEPWMWITVIASATDLGNFFNLRCEKDAQPEIQRIADMVADLYFNNEPQELDFGQWHMPLLFEEDQEIDLEDKKKISTGRCARVSYLTHDGRRDINEDIGLHNRILGSRHMSPFEHIAQAVDSDEFSGNFRGWKQYRKEISGENRMQFDYEKRKSSLR